MLEEEKGPKVFEQEGRVLVEDEVEKALKEDDEEVAERKEENGE